MLLIVTIWTFCLHFFFLVDCNENKKVGFIRVPLCHFEERIDLGLVTVSNTSAEKFDCSRACMHDEMCFGFSYATNGSSGQFSMPGICYFHEEYVTEEKCNIEESETNHVYYRKDRACYNDGIWDETKKRCNCSLPTLLVGQFCTSQPKTCRELSLAGYIPYDDKVELQPVKGLDKVTVHCIVLWDGTALTTIAVSKPYQKSLFNQAWDKYENGFGKFGDVYYWIGFKYFRALLLASDMSSKLSVMTYFGGGWGMMGEMRILNVQIGDASDYYRLTYQGHEETGRYVGAQNYCFKHSNGVRFSSEDTDNDNDPSGHCAHRNAAGWWYDTCESPCNIFGMRNPFRSGNPRPYSIIHARIPTVSVYNLSYALHTVLLVLRN